jgi:hypothetical protein
MNTKPLIAQCRRAYFAILDGLGIKDEDSRHEFNLDNLGIESTRDPAWTLQYWLDAVSLLQTAAGRPNVVKTGIRRKCDARALAAEVGGTVAIEGPRTWQVWTF